MHDVTKIIMQVIANSRAVVNEKLHTQDDYKHLIFYLRCSRFLFLLTLLNLNIRKRMLA